VSDSAQRKAFTRVAYPTRFDQFLVREHVNLDVLAALIQMTRQNLGRLRAGSQKPRQDTIARVVLALRQILGRPVAAAELFYLGEAHDDHTPEAKEFLHDAA
jgi:hypothetical protein